MEIIDNLGSESATLETDEVQTAERSGMAADSTEGGNVLSATSATTDHYVTANAGELVEEAVGGDDGKIIYDYFSCKFGTVADDTAVADEHIVSYMHTFHKQVVAAYNSASLGSSTAVDGDILADCIVVAHFGGGFFTTELEVLGDSANDGTREDAVAITDTASGEHGDAVHKGVIVADNYIGIDVAERTDLAVFTDFGFGMNVC